MSDETKETIVNEEEQGPDYSQHRALISHALKGEPAQMGPIFDGIMKDKVAHVMDVKRAEVGANLFNGNAD